MRTPRGLRIAPHCPRPTRIGKRLRRGEPIVVYPHRMMAAYRGFSETCGPRLRPQSDREENP